MSIQVGERMPSGEFGLMTNAKPVTLSTNELFSAKKVVLVSVPGAFTPTCSAKHLPGFIELADAIRAKGVDTIAFMAVNDVFVMDAWGHDQNVGNAILMLADGNCDYTAALGLDVDSTAFGMGRRGLRFALIVDDGVATHVAVEPPGTFDVSSAESVLGYL
jgi:peroxiredoxin